MAAKKTTKITIGTETVMLVRRDNLPHVWCGGCAAEVEAVAMVSMGMAANVPASVIDQCLNSGGLHMCEVKHSGRWVCLKSLLGLLLRE